MHALRVLRHRLRSLFRSRAVEDDLARELELHLEQLTRERVAQGMSVPDARRAARLEFGSPVLATEQCRDARRLGLLEDFVKDSRYSLRLFRRSAGFALAATLSLALGIGANTAIFSLVDTVLLRSLPMQRPHDLVFLDAAGTDGANGAPPYPWFERVRDETSAFAGMAAFVGGDELGLQVDGRIEQVFGIIASGSYFDVLGLKPAAGRLLTMADESLNPAVAVIGYNYWQRRFGGTPDVIGRMFTAGNRVYTIVGVTPAGFTGLLPGRQVDVTLPITIAAAQMANAETWWLNVIARLRPGVTVAQATAQTDAVFQDFMSGSSIPAETRGRRFDHIELTPAARGLGSLRSRFDRPLYTLMLVAGIVLLIACVNLGNLLLARGTARAHELAIRIATGAGRARLIRQLLTETVWLFAIGAAGGLAVAIVAIQGLTRFFAIGRNPIVLDVHYDWRLVSFAATVALVAGLATGLWPALRALRTSPQSAMKEGEPRVTASPRGRASGRWLLSGQVALSLVLLVVAVLFVRTMVNLRHVDPGFDGRGVLTMSLNPTLRGDAIASAREQFWIKVLARVRALPGVRTASLSVMTPLSGRDTGRRVTFPGFEPRSEADRSVRVNHVSEDYFRTFGIAVRAGREFAATDRSSALKVAVLNETAAKFYFADRNPLGESVEIGASGVYEIVGIVEDHKHRSLRSEAPRFVFVPLWQPVDPNARITLSVSSDTPAGRLTRAISDEVYAIHPNTLISDVIDVDEQINATLVSERLLSTLATSFSVLALGLAAIGLYGVLSYSVTRRHVEFGVRMALGASHVRIATGVMREVLLQVAIGLAIGLPAAAAIARTAEALLFGVTAGDWSTYLASIAILTAVAGVAAWLPARRAYSIDPVEALRRG